ncbi:aminotransferase-like domain-containing protein [Shewanella sairae]|nr:PLP-dependent aminotransferase family protein [Shewanella sairae]MCL1130758.1 PLP-dependent aminotransferase family protein [Shewanella sairae]
MGTIWTPQLNSYSGAKYLRLAQAAEDAINQRELLPNTKLPPQRRLADALGVTVGTVTRAYAVLEQRGYVYAKVGAGTFVRAEDSGFKNKQVNFATCQPPLTNQISVLSDAMNQLAKSPQRLTQLMAYHGEPLLEHQQIFSQWLHKRGIAQQAKQIVFTHGAQQGIFAVLNGLMQAGDTLLCEGNCYPGIHTAAAQLAINIEPITLNDEGLDLSELEEKIIAHKPKVLYITPNNQNPTCIQYSQSQRHTILALAKKYNVVILEDDVNYCLSNEWYSPMWSLEQDFDHNEEQRQIIYLSSLSKVFCGGLRQGFLLVPSHYALKIKQAIHSQCWMISPLNTELACRVIQNPEFMGQREQIIAQRQQLCIEMGQRLGLKQRWRGLNGWLQLTLPLKAHHVVTALAQQNLLVRNGDDFNNHQNYIRLSIGDAADNQLFAEQLAQIESCIKSLSQTTYSVV